MIKNLVISPIAVGRIATGDIRVRGNNRLPVKLDFFRITTNTKMQGVWIDHEIRHSLASAEEKLRSIPVRIMFDTPENNFQSGYAAFNSKGRRICSSKSDGLTAHRVTNTQELATVNCVGPETCAFGIENRCKQAAKLMVAMESQFADDPLIGFAHRTTSFNSISAITARLSQYHALNGGQIAGMPCNLVLRAKSTAASMGQPIFYVDLEPRTNLFSALASAKEHHKNCTEAGLDLSALDAAVSRGLARNQTLFNPEDFETDLTDFDGDAPIELKGIGLPQESANGPISGVESAGDGQSATRTGSPAFMDVMARIANVDSLLAAENLKVWIERVRAFSGSGERSKALAELADRTNQLTAKAA